MAFDAGTIIARLDLETRDYDRKLAERQRTAQRFEADRIKATQAATDAEVSQAKEASRKIEVEAERAHRSILRSLTLGMLGGGGRGGGGAGGGGGANMGWGSGLFRGIGPGVIGIGARQALIAGGIGTAGALLPSLAAGGGVLGVGAIGAGVAAAGARAVIGTKKDPGELYQPAQQAMKQLQAFIKNAAQPLVAPLRRVFAELPRILHDLLPAMRQLFAGAGTLIMPIVRALSRLAQDVLPLLGRAFRAVAPLIGPLIGGFGRLLTGLLPGLISLLRAARPAVSAIASVLGTLGRGVGMMLREFAPAVRASAIVLRAVGSVIAALLPVIGKLASIFARTLAPIVVDFARVLRALTPTLVIVGRVLAALAAAVLKDLVAAFGALARLLIAIAPSIRILARALSQMFDILESSGAFAAFGSALEQIVPTLARLINLVVRQLAPILPTVIDLFAQFATLLISLLATGLETILGWVISLIRHFPALVPILAAATAAFWLFNIALDANPIGAVILAIVALVGAGTLLVRHWRTVWNVIKSAAAAAWRFLTDGWGQYLFPELKLIRVVVEFVRDHWRDAWHTMIQIGKDFWQWIWNDFGAKILRFFTQTLPRWFRMGYQFFRDNFITPWRNLASGFVNWIHDHLVTPIANFFTKTLPAKFGDAVDAISRAWNRIKNVVRAPVAWVIDHVVNGLISAFDWISKRVGGPQIPHVHPFGLATGGRIPGYGGGDKHVALLEGGEAVVSKETTARHAAELRSWGVPGFQHGGRVGQSPPGTAGAGARAAAESRALARDQPLGGKLADIGKIMAALATGNNTALSNAIMDLFPHGVGGAVADLAQLLIALPKRLLSLVVHKLMSYGGALGGRGGQVARYAMSFAGRVPYVWGGTAVPGGADCSGFVQAIYRHFGIFAPRTSEAQGGWVRRGAPVTGGLAFYNSPAGGPPPGHVAIVGFGGNVISQGGGMGPQIQGLRSMPFMFAGVPPGQSALGALGGSLRMRQLANLWIQAGGPPRLAHIMAAIGMAESGGRAGVVNSIGASGIWQIYGLPFPGNPLIPFTNARMAVAKWRSQGLRAWEAYTNGTYRQFMDAGGWLEPGASHIMNATGRPEAVLNPGQSEAFLALAHAVHEQGSRWPGTGSLEARLDRLIKAVERNAAQTGAAVGDALNGAAREAAYRSAYSVR